MGRPKGSGKIRLNDDQLKQLESMAAIGLPTKYMAPILGISIITLDRMIRDNAEVSDRISKGRAKAMGAAFKTAYEMGVVEKNVTMLIFWLKTRAGWKEERDPDESEQIIRLAYAVPPPPKKPDGIEE